MVQNNRRVLTKIQLTIEGKKAIGRIGETVTSIENPVKATEQKHVSVEDILKAIPRLKKENPDFDIIFKVILKEE